jgi:hypothetical protein
VEEIVKRIALLLGLCALLLPMTAWADNIVGLTNQFGSVSLTDAGIVSTGSDITGFHRNWRKAPPGHVLGSISFSTGALIEGSILGGGIFSGTGSSFVATGKGKYGVPKGTIFSGSFVGPVDWTLVSHVGNDYVFDLAGNLSGMLYTGRLVTGTTSQTIYVNQTQQGHIHGGNTNLGSTAILWAEPDTLVLSTTGLIVIIGTMRRKLFRA